MLCVKLQEKKLFLELSLCFCLFSHYLGTFTIFIQKSYVLFYFVFLTFR